MNPFWAARQKYEKLRKLTSDKQYYLDDIAWAYYRIWANTEKKAFLERRKGILTGEIKATEEDLSAQKRWESPDIRDDTVTRVDNRLKLVQSPEQFSDHLEHCFKQVSALNKQMRDIENEP